MTKTSLSDFFIFQHKWNMDNTYLLKQFSGEIQQEIVFLFAIQSLYFAQALTAPLQCKHNTQQSKLVLQARPELINEKLLSASTVRITPCPSNFSKPCLCSGKPPAPAPLSVGVPYFLCGSVHTGEDMFTQEIAAVNKLPAVSLKGFVFQYLGCHDSERMTRTKIISGLFCFVVFRKNGNQVAIFTWVQP